MPPDALRQVVGLTREVAQPRPGSALPRAGCARDAPPRYHLADARSGRSIVCVKKNRNAETMLFIVGVAFARIARCSVRNRRTLIRRSRIG